MTALDDPTAAADPSGAARPAQAAVALFSRPHRLPTVGLLLVVTLIAFESMAVATVMPTAVRDLRGLPLYGWAFTGFLIPSVVGIVVAGDRSDRSGPAPPLLGGLALFAAGLILAGAAPAMPLFVAGRAVQGLGAGAVIVAVYVVIARVYDEGQRPRVFAAMSAAWVLPALLGPVLAGAVAEHLHWRWVFLGLPPLVGLGVALLLPALRRLPHRADPLSTAAGPLPHRAGPPPTGADPLSTGADPLSTAGGRGRVAARLAVGVGLLQTAGQQLRPTSAALAVAGLGLLAVPLRRLLPSGTLTARPGLPAVVAFRGLLAASFFGAEAFLPLTLTTVHHLRPTTAGLPLTVGALGWAVGSWLQGRRPPGRPRYPLVRAGFGLIALGVGSLVAVTFATTPPWLAVLSWSVAGAGMGLAMATISVLVLFFSTEAEQGANSAALQISDVVGSVVGIGLGGMLLAAGSAAGAPAGSAIAVTYLVMAALATAGLLLAGRAGPAGG